MYRRASAIERTPAIADVAQEGRLIDEPEDEFGVVLVELPEFEPFRRDHDHWCSAQNGNTLRSTKFILR